MKKCWFWQHEYRLNLQATERYNESALYTFGTKLYICTKCGHGKAVWPRDVF